MNPAYRFLRYTMWPKVPTSVAKPLILRRRRSLFDAFRKVGAVFVHVPRTGGTSVSTALYPIWIDHFTMQEHLDFFPRDLLALPRFAVVRNPWERAVSSWSFAKAGTGVDRLFGIPHADTYRVPEFQTFEDFIFKWLSGRDLAELAPIFRPQSEFVVGASGAIEIDHLGALDRLAETEIWISDVVGRPVSFPKMNASAHGDYRDFYTPALRERVAQIYADDVARFGYRF